MGGGEKVFLEPRHEVKDAWSTWEKSEKLLNYRDNHSLEEGVSIMWDWAKKQPRRVQMMWESYELSKGIYKYWE